MNRVALEVESLTQLDARVKTTIGAQDVHICLSIITFVGLVDVSLGQNDQAGAIVVPFELHFVALEECFLGDGCVELRHAEDLDCSWLTLPTKCLLANGIVVHHDIASHLAFGNKNSN